MTLMHTNFTPLDFAKVRPETKTTKAPEKKTKSKGSKDYDLIDKIFFPFALAVLVISLSLYAVKFVIESANTPASANTEAEQIVDDLTGSPTPASQEPTTSETRESVYKKINAIDINTEKITSTAGVRYPNLSEKELTENINSSLLQWAALRAFFATKSAILNQLTVPVNEPVATYSAVIRDLGVLTGQYDKQTGSPKPITEVVEEFKKTSTIQ